MIIETKYNTIDEFLCQFSGIQIVSVEFEYDFARYTIGFYSYVDEYYFKACFEKWIEEMQHLEKCFAKSVIDNVKTYRPVNESKNVFRKVNKNENM